MSYLATAPRSAGDKARLNRILRALGTARLADIDQGMIDRVRAKVLRPDAAPATAARGVVIPIRAVLRHAARRGWCDLPFVETPRQPQGRTRFLLPAEAEQLVKAAAPHLKGLLIFLLCTGARLSEALGLEWRDVDLQGARAIFWADQTKSRRRRTARLPARALVSLAALPGRDGHVFRTPLGEPYRTSRERGYGGQIKTAWRGALRRADKSVQIGTFTPHDLRHTWASWHYALHHDILALKAEGGWSSVELVERYAHLLPAGHEAEIRAFWHVADTDAGSDRASA
ncbi:MAG: tyrosine-type recombinase/integrase [Candidatus Binataceae bacterium]|nr:tyrosine-type recombinase/integrase [Candidatus Binataceae bacterium]